MLDLDKYHSSKRVPVQKRSKETIRQILLAAADLFAKKGAAEVTTNEIAAHAGVPIGSVYGYFEDKNDIIASLLDLYDIDVMEIADDLVGNPLLTKMSRYEIISIITHAWVYYLEINHPLSYILYARSEPSLAPKVAEQRKRLQESFCRVVHTWNPARTHSTGPDSSCLIMLQQGLSMVETAELAYRNDAESKQEYLAAAIPAYCEFVAALK